MTQINPSVLVLMSTYNGEDYLKEQINSVLNQKNVDVHILIRDDGSKDRTLQILKDYSSDVIDVIKGDNIGATKSFFTLIDACDDTYDYFALCDQDDVWDIDKLNIAIRRLEVYEEKPALYSSNTRLVNEDRGLISIETQDPIITIGSAFVKNYVTGCTTVFNKNLLRLLRGRLDNVVSKSHEWWCNLVCLANDGVSIYDLEPHMDYRQHGNNVVGAPTSFISKWYGRYKKFKNNTYNRPKMAEQLLEKYKDISKENYEIINRIMMGRENKLKLIVDKRIKTRSNVDNICFALLVITGKI